ncbi:hypothetical protein LBMAG48_18470 [Phycisphaerae bacterium]|nr:hypothetical protein LBMAG48_18470 [Phycisphaerae bacterium]
MKCVKLGLVSGLLLAAGTASGAINYRVNGVAYNPPGFNPAAPVIDVGALTANTTIHVFDDVGLDEDVPAITVRGTAGFGVVLKVQVVDGGDADGFDQSFLFPHGSGARSFGGLRVEGPLSDPADTTLRDATAVVVGRWHQARRAIVPLGLALKA